MSWKKPTISDSEIVQKVLDSLTDDEKHELKVWISRLTEEFQPRSLWGPFKKEDER